MNPTTNWYLSPILFLAAERASRSSRGNALTGVKTVGGTNPDFATLSDALVALRTQGVGAAGAIFDIRPGTHEGPFVIDPGTIGASVTFRKDPSVPGEAVLRSASSGTVLEIRGAQNQVILEDLTVVARNQHAVRFLSPEAGVLEVRDCEIELASDAYSATAFHAVYNDSESSHVLLRGNRVTVKSETAACLGLVLRGEVDLSENRIEGQGSQAQVGLDLSSPHSKILLNNLVKGFVRAIRLSGGESILSQNVLIGGAKTLRLVKVLGTASLKFYDNIACASASGASCFTVTTSGRVESDHNAFWMPEGAMGSWMRRTARTLTQWREASGQDEESREDSEFAFDAGS